MDETKAGQEAGTPRTPFHGYASFDGMCWPPPIGAAQSDARWALVYGKPTRAQLQLAAAVMEAYQTLVYQPERVRAKVIRSLRVMGARQYPSVEPPARPPTTDGSVSMAGKET